MLSLRIAVRADGDDRIGAGHVARCLPLARRFAELGHSPRFVGSCTGFAGELLREAGIESVRPRPDQPAGVSAAEFDAALLDSYAIPAQEICALANVMPIATVAEAARCPDRGVVLDYHLDRAGEPPTERLLAGPRYAPVDPRFIAARRPRRTVERVLVTAGGGRAGEAMTGLAIDAVGLVFPQAIVMARSRPGAQPANVLSFPAATRLWEVAPAADVAVSAGGLSAYELACAGVPMVLVAIVENQRQVARAFAGARAAVVPDCVAQPLADALREGRGELVDPARRAALSARGMELVDGLGAARAAEALLMRWKQNARSLAN